MRTWRVFKDSPSSDVLQEYEGTFDKGQLGFKQAKAAVLSRLDYGELITAREIEDNLGIDVGIIPTLMDNIPKGDHFKSNGIWAGTTKILRSQIFDFD